MREILEILHQYSRDCQPAQVESLGSAGGMSGAQFWRIHAPRGPLCLRRWPTEHPTPQRLRFIHCVLLHAVGRGVISVPEPIRTRDDQTFVAHAGHLWELARWMPGTADYERSPGVEKLRAAMRALAEFHAATNDFKMADTGHGADGAVGVARPSSAVSRRLVRLRQLSSGGIAQLAAAVTNTTWPDFAPLARQFITKLPRAAAEAIAQLEPLVNVPLPLQPCLRDIWHDHVLFVGESVAGIVDFGAIDIDTPACDVARLLASLVGDDAAGWQNGLAAYSAKRLLSAVELRAITALDTSGTVLAGCNWIRWIYVEGRLFESPTQVIERFQKIAARLKG